MDDRTSQWIDAVRQDARFTLRSLRRAPGFAVAVIVTLALCIGANTTVSSVLYRLILKPLPFAHADQLVEVYQSMPKFDQPKRRMSVAQYTDYRATADLFAGFALWSVWTFNIGEDSDPERGIGAKVTADYFRLTGVQPLLRRFFTLEESTPGKDNVLVLSQTYWESKFGSDPPSASPRPSTSAGSCAVCFLTCSHGISRLTASWSARCSPSRCWPVGSRRVAPRPSTHSRRCVRSDLGWGDREHLRLPLENKGRQWRQG